MKKLIQALVLSFVVFAATIVVAQPSVREIYQTAQTDKQQALNMINEVIRTRPNSARAYYVQSELLLQLGKRSEARSAFQRSETLDPTLSFAKPESVERLRQALGIKKNSGSGLSMSTDQLILWGCGALLAILIVVMIMRRRKPAAALYPSSYNLQNRPITPYQSSQNITPHQPGQTTPSYQGNTQTAAPGAPATSGNSLMGSLAQGAVMGAGVAAGATLVNHLLNGNKAAAEPTTSAQPSVDGSSSSSGYVPDSDFGIGDTGGDWGGSADDSGEW